jgi:hypothetical protein
MVPDAEKIVGGYLRAHPALVALDVRVVGKTPARTDTPWIRLTQLDDPAVGGHRSDHLIEFLLQLDIYAGREGGQPEAALVNRTCREALRTMIGEHGDAVVTGVEFLSAIRLPDTDGFEPARERFIRTVRVWMHP